MNFNIYYTIITILIPFIGYWIVNKTINDKMILKATNMIANCDQIDDLLAANTYTWNRLQIVLHFPECVNQCLILGCREFERFDKIKTKLFCCCGGGCDCFLGCERCGCLCDFCLFFLFFGLPISVRNRQEVYSNRIIVPQF